MEKMVKNFNGKLRMETEYVDGIEVKERKLYTDDGVLES